MASKLRLCRAIQSARASASATVVIGSTSTASYSPKIKVDVIGSKPNASPKGFGRSPTIAFPGAVKTLTLSVVSFSPFVPSIWFSFRCNIRNADIHTAADLMRVGEDAKRYRRLVGGRPGGRPAPNVDKEPSIRDLNVPRRALAVASAQSATAEDRFIEAKRSVDVGDGEKMCDADSVPRGHLIALLFDLYGVH